jgi:hypothetical protein
VVEENQVLVDVNALAFHRVAGDAGDGFTSRYSGTVARNPLRVGESRKSEGGTGKQNTRAKSHSDSGSGLGNLLPGAACCKIGR